MYTQRHSGTSVWMQHRNRKGLTQDARIIKP